MSESRAQYMSDAYLIECHEGKHGLGPQNAAHLFEQVPFKDRAEVNRLGTRIGNTSGGFNYSGQVYAAVQQYLRSPETFTANRQAESKRTAECQAWERRTGAVASMKSFLGKPGDPIE